MLDPAQINKQWTLFLDRDGVINQEKDPYVCRREDFIFNDGVLEALKIFNDIFKYIIIATNQRGVGRQMMTENDLIGIHDTMLKAINSSGGRIDKIYYSISMDDSDPFRKPNPGMALEAKKDFPLISMQQSIMIGNNISDMEFGRNAGSHTILLTTTGTRVKLPHPLVDLQFDALIDFARILVSQHT